MNGLPQNWGIAEIRDVSIPTKHVDPQSLFNESFKYVDISSIDSNIFKVVDAKLINTKEAPSRARQLIKKNDIVFSTVRTNLKRIARIDDELDNQIASTGFAVIRPSSHVHPTYIFYYLISDKFIDEITSLQRGASYPAVRPSDIFSRKIPIAPFPEQKHIVAKLDSLFGHLDQLKARLENIPVLLKQFRQAVLTQAVTGKLTEEWRRKNKTNESAVNLLERIKIRRTKEYNDLLHKAKVEGKRKPSKRHLLEIPEITDGKTTEIPESWTLTNVDFLAYVTKLAGFEYSEHINFETSGEIPVVRAQNVQMGRFVEENLVYISKETSDFLERSQLHGREILMVFIGAGTGNVCMAPSDKRWHLAPNVAKIDVDGISSEYLYLYLQSPVGLENMNSFIKATAQPSLSMETIRQIIVQLPPFEEQKEIVRSVESLFAIADKIEASYKTLQEKIDHLPQAILAKAFRGELVAQKVEDELKKYNLQAEKFSLAAEP